MVLFNVTLLNRPAQNILVFDILMDLILVLLVYLRSYSSMSDRVSAYFKQHKLLLKPWFDCFLACSIIKVNCNINIKNLGLHLRVFTHLTVYIFSCLISGKYLNKCCNSLSAIILFLLFTIYLTYSSISMVLSTVLKFANFNISLFFTNLILKIFIILLFLTRAQTQYYLIMIFLASKNLIENHVNRNPFQLIHDKNLFNNNYNLFSMFLTNSNSSVEFTICLEIPFGEGSYHMEFIPPICIINPLTVFCVFGDFSWGYSQRDFNFNFNINNSVTVESDINSIFNFNFFTSPRIFTCFLNY